ncbi:unnamed protein product, partial [Mesorhabditis belari]|uniref:EGF-like domain-containing protein n=1 Tax=Mesorhabditis belari TaxID=2138241 RepID=A0AAF3F5G1_9BILA
MQLLGYLLMIWLILVITMGYPHRNRHSRPYKISELIDEEIERSLERSRDRIEEKLRRGRRSHHLHRDPECSSRGQKDPSVPKSEGFKCNCEPHFHGPTCKHFESWECTTKGECPGYPEFKFTCEEVSNLNKRYCILHSP